MEHLFLTEEARLLFKKFREFAMSYVGQKIMPQLVHLDVLATGAVHTLPESIVRAENRLHGERGNQEVTVSSFEYASRLKGAGLKTKGAWASQVLLKNLFYLPAYAPKF